MKLKSFDLPAYVPQKVTYQEIFNLTLQLYIIFSPIKKKNGDKLYNSFKAIRHVFDSFHGFQTGHMHAKSKSITKNSQTHQFHAILISDCNNCREGNDIFKKFN